MKVWAVTPNWNQAHGLLPTDTLRPPPNFPLEWGYLDRDIAANGSPIDLVICDEYLRNRPLNDFLASVAVDPPDVFLISTAPSYLFWRCPPTSLELVSRYISGVRSVLPASVSILVGPHGTAQPTSALRITGADFAYRGEVDPHLARILESFSDGVPSAALATKATTGMVHPELPLGDHGLIYDTRYLAAARPHAWLPEATRTLSQLSGSHALLETSRGCYFDCGYCFRSGFRRLLRLKPIKALEEELDALHSAGVAYVFLIDETFGIPRPHAREVLRLLRGHGIAFGIQTRPDIWTQESVQELAASGCVYVELGTESRSMVGVTALGKYSQPQHALKMTDHFKALIPYVGVNIVDVGNADLALLPRAVARKERDNEGERPPAFIPYPTTPWGERALAAAGLRADWESTDELYAVYCLAAHGGPLSWLLRESRGARSITRNVVHALAPVLRRLWCASSRHERRRPTPPLLGETGSRELMKVRAGWRPRT